MTVESIYKKEEIFSEVDQETGKVLMTIPDEVKARMGWKEGDTLTFTVNEEGHIQGSKVDVDSTKE